MIIFILRTIGKENLSDKSANTSNYLWNTMFSSGGNQGGKTA